MFVVQHAGFSYGPFDKADDAAEWATDTKIGGPWTIVKLRKPLTAEEAHRIREKFEKEYADK